jgi:hypothetical protein
VITNLNEVSSQIYDKKNLTERDTNLIKDMFFRILECGDRYDVDEVEAWLENEGSWTHKPSIVRITNMSHYVQSRFDQNPRKLRVVSDSDECGCH